MSVSNEFKNITKKIKQQNIKLSICDGELTVKEIHMMPVHIFNALPVWKLRKQKVIIAKKLKYSFDGQLFKTIMKQVEITVKNANEIKDKDINFQYGLFINNKFEYIDLGNYFIKDVEDSKKKDEITVTGYDRMIRFMKTFKQSELQLTYPCKMLKLVQKMCEVCGVELYSTDFYNADLDVEEDFFTAQELTYRDVLEKIAQATLTTAFIEDNKLNLYKINDEDSEKIDKSYLTDLTIKEKFGPANVLVLGRGDVEDNIEEYDEESIKQNGRCEIRFDENEFIEYQREKVIKGMFNQIKGLEYYSFEASDIGVMWLKPCTCIKLGDKEDNLYKSYYLKANITINTGISSDIEAELPEQTNTEYKVTTKEEKKTLKVERLAKKNEGLIQDIIEENSEQSQKLSKVEQTVNGITQSVSKVEEKVGNVENVANTAKTTADTAKSTADSTNKNLTTNYYTKTQTENKITQTAESTISEVSKTYSTKTETSTAKTEAINSANSSTDNKLKGYTETSKLGTAIEQNYEHVKVAWNQISDFIQMMIIKNNASLAILDKYKNIMMALDKTGQHFYKDSGTEFGEMGVQKVDNQNYISFSVPIDYNSSVSDGMAWGVKNKKTSKFLPILYIKNFELGEENSDALSGELVLSACNLVLEGIGTGIKTGSIFISGDSTSGNLTFFDTNSNTALMTVCPSNIIDYPMIYILDNIQFYKNQNGSCSFRIGMGDKHCLLTDEGDFSCNHIYCDGDIYATGYVNGKKFIDNSREEMKKNIQKYTEKAIEVVKNTDIYKFNYKTEKDTNKKCVGFIIGEDYKYSKELTSTDENGKEIGANLYSMISIAYKAIQEQQEQIEQLQLKDKQKDELIQSLIKRIETLEKEVNR